MYVCIYVLIHSPKQSLLYGVFSRIKGLMKVSRPRAPTGTLNNEFCSWFYKHRRFRPPFTLQREGPSTTRVAATATFLSPVSTKQIRNSLFDSKISLFQTKKTIFVHDFANRSWLPDPGF